jgi:hypothetical protein
MTCEQVSEYIPALVRRELSGYMRIPVLTHLRQCPGCQAEYRDYLKMFYTIDLEILSNPPVIQPDDHTYLAEYRQPSATGRRNMFRFRYWYLTAAVLTCAAISVFVLFYLFADKGEWSGDKNLTAAEAQLFTGSDFLISDPQLQSMLAHDSIPVGFLEKQLMLLQQRGISSFRFQPVASPKIGVQIFALTSLQNTPLSVAVCLNKVRSIKKYKSNLTIPELVLFLGAIEKQGA